jgi:hypothetical protein
MGEPFSSRAGRGGQPPAPVRVLTCLLLFGVAFGFMEAATAIYLRGLYEPIHRRVFPDRAPGDLFPLIPPDRLEAEKPQALDWLVMELLREGATLVMLAAVGVGLARSFQHGFGVFLIAFGLWDVFYYVFLKVLIDWPASLCSWDLLFLLPVPWAAPVLAPVLVALGMIGTGLLILRREGVGRPLRLGLLHWLALLAGGLIIVTSFCWDYRNLLAGGEPDSFNWGLFAAGGAVGAAALGHAWQFNPSRAIKEFDSPTGTGLT